MRSLAGLVGLWVLLVCGGISAYLTHVVWIVKALASDHGATVGQMVLGVLGGIVAPIGVVHGVVLWFA